MNKITPLLLVLLLASCNPVRGFLESEFNLSPDSPLPAWYPKLPDGYKREDVTIRILFLLLRVAGGIRYTKERGRVKITLDTGRGHKEIGQHALIQVM
jgi:hypothetical protein